MHTLLDHISRSLERREPLISELTRSQTDAYRLFHGVAEGQPGLTVDRYGPVLLVQTFREPLEAASLDALVGRVADELAWEPVVVLRHRGQGSAPVSEAPPETELSHTFREHGVRYTFDAHHQGQDPLLFLDLRNARARVLSTVAGQSVLNLFAYTCGVGVCAAVGEASEVWNVDFSSSALDHGRTNASLNETGDTRLRFIEQNAIPVLRQVAGLPIRGRARKRQFRRFPQTLFDLVFLDPPRWARSPFGAVDVRRDYQTLFKPSVLATHPGGRIICTNHLPDVSLDEWLTALHRCAAKAGRPIQEVEALPCPADFPSFDAAPPLKVAVVHL